MTFQMEMVLVGEMLFKSMRTFVMGFSFVRPILQRDDENGTW